MCFALSRYSATAAAAPTASALAAAAARKTVAEQQNTMARKDGEGRKLHPKTPERNF